MIIDINTKIGALIRECPDALEAIVSISPKFKKLRNPILRKVIASRATITMASRIGGCSVDVFFDKLKPLGFQIDQSGVEVAPEVEILPVPEFMSTVGPANISELDVRPVIESGKDPFNVILLRVKSLGSGHILKLINSFEPTPLIHLLGKQGFESYVEQVSDDLVNTYFYRNTAVPLVIPEVKDDDLTGWEEVRERFKGNMQTIDVRSLEMPLPMHAILEAIETLPADKALFVYHKRIPVYLLPELDDHKFSYRINEISDAEVHLLIYKD